MARPLGVAQVHHLWRSALPSALNLLFFLPLAPPTLPPALWILVPSLTLSVAVLIFPDACPSVVAAVWANKQARGPSESQTACCGFLFAWVDPRAGESFLKRCAERSKAQRRDCNTNICPPLPPAPDVHSVLPPPRRKRKDSSLILSKGEICPTDSDILPNRLAKVQSPGFIHVVMIVV